MEDFEKIPKEFEKITKECEMIPEEFEKILKSPRVLFSKEFERNLRALVFYFRKSVRYS